MNLERHSLQETGPKYSMYSIALRCLCGVSCPLRALLFTLKYVEYILTFKALGVLVCIDFETIQWGIFLSYGKFCSHSFWSLDFVSLLLTMHL